MRLLGQRALLLDVVALGLLRKELIASIGLLGARGVLTRFGYAHGWRYAETLKKESPDLYNDGRIGAFLHQFTGQATIEEHVRSQSRDAGYLVDCSWKDSYEAQQHLLHLGPSDAPVCWAQTGFASGFNSYRAGKEIYFVEDRCIGMGATSCHLLARTREQWGPEADSFLHYYHPDSVDAALQEISQKLQQLDHKIHQRRQKLALLEKYDEEPPGVIVRSDIMRLVLTRARRIARSEASTVVTGESGSGKEVFAKLIHSESSRAGGPFVVVSCGAKEEHLLERDLFGSARFASEDPSSDGVGLFEAAAGGTLFLDEVTELSLALQLKLLRVLEARAIIRVGESKPRSVDVRMVAATSRDLATEVSRARFRSDLFYRLNVVGLHLPPLRERVQDIVPLARTFLHQFATETGQHIEGFTGRALRQLLVYPWPGNVRELRNAVEYAVAFCSDDRVGLEDLPDSIRVGTPRSKPVDDVKPMRDVERDAIRHALDVTEGNRERAAASLQISPATLYRRLKELRDTNQVSTLDQEKSAKDLRLPEVDGEDGDAVPSNRERGETRPPDRKR